MLDGVESWPMAGTPEWCGLPEGDPRKTAAIFDAARHHALRVELAQEARAEASKHIAAEHDWASVARRMVSRDGAYIKRKPLLPSAI